MDVAITGASGLIGSTLRDALLEAGDRPVALVRREPRAGADEIRWDPRTRGIDRDSLEGIGAVVHLAGAGIGDRRWSDERRRVILDSRVDGTALLAETLAALDRPPAAFVSGSAIGFYGDRADEELDESSSAGSGFLADVVSQWERAAGPAQRAGITTSLIRTGIVLARSGGVLKKQLPLFRLGLGGRFGSGDQWMSWISIDDEIRAIRHLIASPIAGPVNLTAPAPVTNAQFTATLGRVLRRPARLPVPLFGPRLLFGRELVDALMLGSQRVAPTALVGAGFAFEHETLEAALRAILERKP